jgi:hypothetical protein
MKHVALRAHFDGEHIQLDEPFELEPGTPVTVMVPSDDLEHADWLRHSQQRLADAYGDDEPEYPLSMIKEPNPELTLPPSTEPVTLRSLVEILLREGPPDPDFADDLESIQRDQPLL